MEHPDLQQLDFGFELEPVANPKPTQKSIKKVQSDFVFDFMDCLSSPIIVYPNSWQDVVPKLLLKDITLARLLTQMQGERMASLTEVVAYMMPRTFEAPIQSEWANIYTWCGLQYAKTFKHAGQMEAMAGIAPENLSNYEQTLLKRLRVWIYEKRREALKKKLKVDKPTAEEPAIQKKLSL
ncbi:hypothetical protein ED312_06430 [Sinomicrobium pectinilyticum]|uniref:Uncharacterized protein n=1 Tax=Sinomicrobium pectinilyticum TaxID=1084421 RepID=A0A3N0ER40_SINP1|nr:hypothetical protein [Sinomicrobium pectinilyticum]RNL90350.1 hypothetical protein ED312_06430 [Sinomicrobium pectinilyticum]